MRFDSRTALLRFLAVVGNLGYQPPFLSKDKIEKMLPGRMNYYLVTIRVLYTKDIEIVFTKGDYIVILTCPKEK